MLVLESYQHTKYCTNNRAPSVASTNNVTPTVALITAEIKDGWEGMAIVKLYNRVTVHQSGHADRLPAQRLTDFVKQQQEEEHRTTQAVGFNWEPTILSPV